MFVVTPTEHLDNIQFRSIYEVHKCRARRVFKFVFPTLSARGDDGYFTIIEKKNEESVVTTIVDVVARRLRQILIIIDTIEVISGRNSDRKLYNPKQMTRERTTFE